MFSGIGWALAYHINDRKEVKTENMLLGGGTKSFQSFYKTKSI